MSASQINQIDPQSDAALQELLNPAAKITLTQTEACPNGIAEKAVKAVMARIKAAAASSGQTPDVECLVSPSIKAKFSPEFLRQLPRLISHPTVFHGGKDFASPSRQRLEDISSYHGQGKLHEVLQKGEALDKLANYTMRSSDKLVSPTSSFFTGERIALITDDKIEFSLVHTDFMGDTFKDKTLSPDFVFSRKEEAVIYSFLHEIGHGWAGNIYNNNAGQVTFTSEVKADATESVADLFAANAYSCLADQGIVPKNEGMLRGIRDVRIFSQLTGNCPDSYAGTAGIDCINGEWRQVFSQEEIVAASRQVQKLMDQKLGLPQTDAAFLDEMKNKGREGAVVIANGLFNALRLKNEFGITSEEWRKTKSVLFAAMIVGGDSLCSLDIGASCGKNVEKAVVVLGKNILRSKDNEAVVRVLREISLENHFSAGTAAAYLVEKMMKAMERIRPGFTDGTYKKPTLFRRLLRSLAPSA